MNLFELPRQLRKAHGDNTYSLFYVVRNGYNGYWKSQVGRFLRKPDWQKIPLQPFEKNIYEEHPATASRSMTDVDAYREANGVSIKGNHVPKPILAFEESNFPDFVLEELESRPERASPTCIEAHCWPIALSCRDFLAIAETGPQKDFAYVLPAVIHVRHQPALKAGEGPIAVLLAPTRELAKRIENVASELAKRAGVRCVRAATGEPKEDQYAQIRQGCHICVATPRRLVEFIEEGKLNLYRCTYLVLDEADRMLRMGFEPDVLKIAELCRPDRQTSIWATSWQKNFKPFVEALLDDYVELKFGTTRLLSVQNHVEMAVDICQEDEKEAKLAELLDNVLGEKSSRAVVFTDTKRKADEIAWKLRLRNWTAVSVHGGKAAEERHWALSMFRNGGAAVLVATDMVAQDLVLDNVRLVVNYDCPDCSEAYARRSSHVARSDVLGVVHTFIVPTQELHARVLIEILEDAKRPVKPELYDVAKKVRPKRKSV